MGKKRSVATIIVKGNHYDDIDKYLKKFSKITSGIISEYKKVLDHYSKPSEIRHRKASEHKRARLIERGIIKKKRRRTKKGDNRRNDRNERR